MLWLLACTAEPPGARPGDDDDDVTLPTGHTGGVTLPIPTGTTGHTGAAHSALPGYDCDNLPEEPLNINSIRIETTEDFDFDAQARLVYADWNGNLVGVDDTGNEALISPGDFSNDARGIQVLSTGDILVNYISAGKIAKVNPTTGAREDFLVGVNGPNALEVGNGDMVYYTETGWGGGGRGPSVWRYQPSTMSRPEKIGDGFSYPNGLALSPDQLTLYVSDDTNGIFALSYDPGTDTWSPAGQVFDPASGEAYDAMETDVCGNLYSAQFYSGKIYRYNPTTETATFLVDLDDAGSLLWNAIRWGSNRGNWRRDVLYVTSRSKIFALEMGVDGRPQPVDLAP